MSNRTIPLLYWVFMAVVGFSFLSEAWVRLSGPTYYEFPGQIVLTINAAGTGAGATIILAICTYLARRGGLAAPVLRSLGHQLSVAAVVLLPIGYGLCSLGYLAGLFPGWIGAIALVLALVSVGLLLLMSFYLRSRSSQSAS